MKHDNAALCNLVMAAFDEEELSAFCFEHARSVYNLFALGQSHSQRTQLLIEHAIAQNYLEKLLRDIERANPYQYSAFHRRLTSDGSLDQTLVGRRLPRAMQRYDAFFARWVRALTRLDVSPHNFARSLIASLATALQARTGFVLENRDGAWEPTIALDERAVRNVQEVTDGSVRDMLTHALRHNVVLFTEPASGSDSLICAPLVGAHPPALLVFVGLSGTLALDEVVEVTLETILATTRNLTMPVDSESLELHVYDALRRRIGRVSDAMYSRQFDLYRRRLQRMTVFFEPIVYLHPTQPYIWGWEALARDPETQRAPVDLFRIADLWGAQFQLECDLHFLRKAVEAYAFRKSRRARKEEMQTLTVNAYPVSLMRSRYEETLHDLYLNGPMPLNKLIIEISEKSDLPLPDMPNAHGDSYRWMRERLQHLEQFDVRFAIDDFGSGMASSERLTRLGVAVVKIDRTTLLHRFGDSTIQYVIDFARSVPGYVQVIVEGVDHESFFPLRALFDARVRYVQGHWLGVARPDIDRLSIEEVERIRTALQVG